MPSADTNLIIAKIAAHDKKLDKLTSDLSLLALEIKKIGNTIGSMMSYIIKLNDTLVDPPKQHPNPVLPPDTVGPLL